MINPHRLLIVPEDRLATASDARCNAPPIIWVSVCNTMHLEPVEGFPGADIYRFIREKMYTGLTEEESWWVNHQVSYVKKNLEEAMDTWQEKLFQAVINWRAKMNRASKGYKKKNTHHLDLSEPPLAFLRNSRQQPTFVRVAEQFEEQFRIFFREQDGDYKGRMRDELIRWILYRGFVLLGKGDLRTHLPLEYFNSVVQSVTFVKE